jgi:hypothetical protein
LDAAAAAACSQAKCRQPSSIYSSSPFIILMMLFTSFDSRDNPQSLAFAFASSPLWLAGVFLFLSKDFFAENFHKES